MQSLQSLTVSIRKLRSCHDATCSLGIYTDVISHRVMVCCSPPDEAPWTTDMYSCTSNSLSSTLGCTGVTDTGTLSVTQRRSSFLVSGRAHVANEVVWTGCSGCSSWEMILLPMYSVVLDRVPVATRVGHEWVNILHTSGTPSMRGTDLSESV